MEKKKGRGRWSEQELSLIKNTFADNDELVVAIRKVFLQMPLDVIDKSVLDGVFKGNDAAQKLLRKMYDPQLEADMPMMQVFDIWMTVGDIRDKSPEDMAPGISSRLMQIQYMEEQLVRIESGDYDMKEDSISLEQMRPNKGKNEFDMYVDLVTRNSIISFNESQIATFVTLAGLKEETVEETTKRLDQNSSK